MAADVRAVPRQAGTNCIKICLPGKLILSKRKGLWEVLFFRTYYQRINFPGRPIFIQLPPDRGGVRGRRARGGQVQGVAQDLQVAAAQGPRRPHRHGVRPAVRVLPGEVSGSNRFSFTQCSRGNRQYLFDTE